MAKLTLKAAKKAIGVGSFVEKTIKFRDSGGNEFEGEILVKIISHDDIVNATDVFDLKSKNEMTLDQLKRALVFRTAYEDEKTPFFPSVADIGTISTELLNAMYDAADEVLDFSGKNWISAKTKNSGVSSSVAESVEEQ